MDVFKLINESIQYGSNEVRVVGSFENPWFCGKDVAMILGYKNERKAVRDHVQEKHKKTVDELVHLFLITTSSSLTEQKQGERIVPSTTIFVNEPGLYELIMHSRKKEATQFQTFVTEEYLPNLRKHGRYELEQKYQEEMKKLIEDEKLKHQEEVEKLYRQNAELLSLKKRKRREESIYVTSTLNYAKNGIFKIGRTLHLSKRKLDHNAMTVRGDRFVLLHEFQVHDSVSIEKYIHSKLAGLRVEGKLEFYMIPYDRLISYLEQLIQNDCEYDKNVDNLIDVVFELQRGDFQFDMWTKTIDLRVFNEPEIVIVEQEQEEPGTLLKCFICPATFQDAQLRQRHMTIFHPDIRPFECQLCDKKFKKKHKLDRHQAVHRDERPFVCDHCPTKKYKYKEDLRRHYKEQHPASALQADIAYERS